MLYNIQQLQDSKHPIGRSEEKKKKKEEKGSGGACVR